MDIDSVKSKPVEICRLSRHFDDGLLEKIALSPGVLSEKRQQMSSRSSELKLQDSTYSAVQRVDRVYTEASMSTLPKNFIEMGVGSFLSSRRSLTLDDETEAQHSDSDDDIDGPASFETIRRYSNAFTTSRGVAAAVAGSKVSSVEVEEPVLRNQSREKPTPWRVHTADEVLNFSSDLNDGVDHDFADIRRASETQGRSMRKIKLFGQPAPRTLTWLRTMSTSSVTDIDGDTRDSDRTDQTVSPLRSIFSLSRRKKQEPAQPEQDCFWQEKEPSSLFRRRSRKLLKGKLVNDLKKIERIRSMTG
mmetsp:Transcript_6279/g.18944  ORF Transcript_6279/g.18944 Transcript_6279/m.18944 type:complete len:304 (-) Transcript_6279:2678-3589(-)